MKRMMILLAAAFSTNAALANCDAAQGMVDLDRCPVERAQIEREARALENAEKLCVSTTQCNALGTTAFKTGQWRLAIHYFEQQASHAEESRNPLDTMIAYHNAALAHLRVKNCLGARDWLDAATALDPHDKRVAVHEKMMAATCGEQ